MRLPTSAKGLPDLSGIFIDCSRHVEAVIKMQYCGTEKKAKIKLQ
jgi:hypothetical protein